MTTTNLVRVLVEEGRDVPCMYVSRDVVGAAEEFYELPGPLVEAFEQAVDALRDAEQAIRGHIANHRLQPRRCVQSGGVSDVVTLVEYRLIRPDGNLLWACSGPSYLDVAPPVSTATAQHPEQFVLPPWRYEKREQGGEWALLAETHRVTARRWRNPKRLEPG